MYVVIAMAGEGKRFIDYGFREPKFTLIAKGRPLFDWALDSLQCYYKKASFIFVAREGFEGFIAQRCQILGIDSYEVVAIEVPTDGQATTVAKGTELLEEDHPLLIYNIDTHIKPEILQPGDIKASFDGWLLLFPASGTHWSFAKLDEEGRVIEVAEKIRISQFASTGLYYFKSLSLFRDVYSSMRNTIKEKYKEVYIAPLYNVLIEKKKIVGSKVVASEDVLPLGTPDEVARFDPQFFERYAISRR